MAIVKIIKDGNCTGYFDDTYVIHDKDEIDKILKHVSDIYSEYFSKHPEDFKE